MKGSVLADLPAQARAGGNKELPPQARASTRAEASTANVASASPEPARGYDRSLHGPSLEADRQEARRRGEFEQEIAERCRGQEGHTG